jgi:hypothetical protein
VRQGLLPRVLVLVLLPLGLKLLHVTRQVRPLLLVVL